MTEDQEREIVEVLNELTVSVQILASRLMYEAGADAVEAQQRCATANEKLFKAFPQFATLPSDQKD